MAERRMLAKTIIKSDAFLDMPQSARLLYVYFLAEADDDGFLNSPKATMRTIGSSDDDVSILIVKKFIIPFQSGVIAIKHWRIHNYIQTDRYNPTKYIEEKLMLELDENKAYRLKNKGMDTQCIHNGYIVDTQVSLGKVSIGKDNKEIPQEVGQSVARSDNKGGIELANYIGDREELQEAVKNFIKMRKEIRKPMTDQAKSLLVKEMQKLDKSGENIVDCLNASILNSWQGLFPKRKQPLNKGVEVPPWIDTNIKPHIQIDDEVDIDELIEKMKMYK